MRVLCTDADQFLNKRDLLLTEIAGSTPLDIITISEILLKAPNAIVNLSFHGYHCHLNFDPNNYDPDIRGAAVYVHHKLQAHKYSLIHLISMIMFELVSSCRDLTHY